MEGGSLFNPGFLGAHFNWWIGQIASDSTWRDNILPGKFEDKNQISGWGRRYKVRILGLHDQGETEVPSDQLPWAQVMYPVTGGGGQAHASATANLRQGMFVFGFFLDGQEQQVPVIMGVLGNNAQTELATKIGDNRVTNTQPGSLATSGHATPADGNKDPFIRVPDEGLVITKPKTQEQSEECAPVPPGVAVNEYGLRSDKPLTSLQYIDQQSAIAEADARGLTGTERSNFIQKAVADGIAARCQAASSPTSPSQPGATRENVDAVHEQSKADIVRNDYYNLKTVLMSPCDTVQSAMKAIQIELENLTKAIDKVLNAAQSYVDAVSNLLSSISELIANFACTIAKYMTIIFKKIMEYILKKINTALSPTVDLLPPNQRHRFFDIKVNTTELITCLYGKLIEGLCGLIESLLNEQIKTELPSDSSTTNPKTPKTPVVNVCSVETLVGNCIAVSLDEVNNEVNGVLDNINNFLNDVQYELGIISGAISLTKEVIDGISASITSALSFQNIKLNIFGCDLTPSCPASDYFTIQNGSGSTEDSQQPRASEVNKAAQNPTTTVTPPTELPFAQPSKNEPPLINSINQATQFVSAL